MKFKNGICVFRGSSFNRDPEGSASRIIQHRLETLPYGSRLNYGPISAAILSRLLMK